MREQITCRGNTHYKFGYDELKKELRQRGVEVDIQGKRIIPKKLLVTRVNLGNFRQKGSFKQMDVFVTGPRQRVLQHSVQLQSGKGMLDVAGRVGALEASLARLKQATDTKLAELDDSRPFCDAVTGGNPVKIVANQAAGMVPGMKIKWA